MRKWRRSEVLGARGTSSLRMLRCLLAGSIVPTASPVPPLHGHVRYDAPASLSRREYRSTSTPIMVDRAHVTEWTIGSPKRHDSRSSDSLVYLTLVPEVSDPTPVTGR